MSSDAVTVFFSYSHKDEALRDELVKHLEILKWNHDISAWHDHKISPGDEWDREIKDSLNSAQVILLLVSSDFIASPYCRDVEITRAVERHNAGEACVIPVILRTCMWSLAPFGKLQALPKNARPVTDTATWPTEDDAFTNIAEGIKKVADNIRQGRQKLEQYRQEVRLCLQDEKGEISPFSRSILSGFRTSFSLTPEEAEAVEQEELIPYQVKAKAIEQYSKVFAEALAHENPPREAIRSQMQRFQNTLGLSDDEVYEIEMILSKKPDETTDPESVLPVVSRKELSECDSSKLLFLKNVRDPNGSWAYSINLIQDMEGSVESRVFELFWLTTSRGARSASKGDLMLLNQHAKITHVVEMLDDDVRKNESGYFRWVRVVWMPEELDWSQLPHQRDVIGFEPPTIGGGTAYWLANLSKFKETWNSLEAFQQHVYQILTGTTFNKLN